MSLERLLARLWHLAAVLALGYLLLGYRGILVALVLRESLALAASLLRRFI